MTSDSLQNEAIEHYFQAVDFFKADQFDSAAGEALLAIKASPTPYIQAERLLALTYLSGDVPSEDVIAQYQKLTKLVPNDAGSWLKLGVYTLDLREYFLKEAEKTKNLSLHRTADKYHKISRKALNEAQERFPTFVKDPNEAEAFAVSYELPNLTGDYFAESSTIPIKDALFWHGIAASYDVEGILANFLASGLWLEEELERFRVGLTEEKAQGQRKQAFLENSSLSKKKVNRTVGRTMSQRMAINIAIIILVVLFVCWGLYALIT